MTDALRRTASDCGNISDRSLVRRLRSGSEDAATQIYLRYAERLQALSRQQSSPDLAVRVDPEDIVQSVFRTFFRRVQFGDYDVPDGEELWKLLLVIGLHKIRSVGSHHRAAKRDVRTTRGGEEFDRAADTVDSGEENSLAVLKMTIDDVLAALSDSHRECIQLRIEGYEVAEIADMLGRSKRSVERLLQSFRQGLMSQVSEES